jgi:hypothetical protein
MQQLETVNNPFSVIHYNCSWAAIKEQLFEIMQRFPSRYKMAYHEEDEQKIILFTSLDFTVFGREHLMVIYISKIDSCVNNCMLAYEAKNYAGDVTAKEEQNRGQYFIDSLAEDMMILY